MNELEIVNLRKSLKEHLRNKSELERIEAILLDMGNAECCLKYSYPAMGIWEIDITKELAMFCLTSRANTLRGRIETTEKQFAPVLKF